MPMTSYFSQDFLSMAPFDFEVKSSLDYDAYQLIELVQFNYNRLTILSRHGNEEILNAIQLYNRL